MAATCLAHSSHSPPSASDTLLTLPRRTERQASALRPHTHPIAHSTPLLPPPRHPFPTLSAGAPICHHSPHLQQHREGVIGVVMRRCGLVRGAGWGVVWPARRHRCAATAPRARIPPAGHTDPAGHSPIARLLPTRGLPLPEHSDTAAPGGPPAPLAIPDLPHSSRLHPTHPNSPRHSSAARSTPPRPCRPRRRSTAHHTACCSCTHSIELLAEFQPLARLDDAPLPTQINLSPQPLPLHTHRATAGGWPVVAGAGPGLLSTQATDTVCVCGSLAGPTMTRSSTLRVYAHTQPPNHPFSNSL